MGLATVEYRADKEKRRGQVSFKLNNYRVSLQPGLNQIALDVLADLETVNYFQQGVERRVFIVTKPTVVSKEPDKPVEEKTKQEKVKATVTPTPTKATTTAKTPSKTAPKDLILDDDDD